VGDSVIRRATVLELDQPGCHLRRRQRISTAAANGLCRRIFRLLNKLFVK